MQQPYQVTTKPSTLVRFRQGLCVTLMLGGVPLQVLPAGNPCGLGQSCQTHLLLSHRPEKQEPCRSSKWKEHPSLHPDCNCLC